MLQCLTCAICCGVHKEAYYQILLHPSFHPNCSNQHFPTTLYYIVSSAKLFFFSSSTNSRVPRELIFGIRHPVGLWPFKKKLYFNAFQPKNLLESSRHNFFGSKASISGNKLHFRKLLRKEKCRVKKIMKMQ